MHFYAGVELFQGKNEDAGCVSERYAIVCDGLGGRAKAHFQMENGEVWNDSRYASRLVCKTMETVICGHLDDWTQAMQACRSMEELDARCVEIKTLLHDEIVRAYQATAERYPDKDLTMATTIACWITFPWHDGSTLALALWAGDSRCYLQDAEQMHVFSKDDTDVDADAMQELQIGSPIMNNRVGMDYLRDVSRREKGGFWINHRVARVQAPALLAAASDGFYHLKTAISPMAAEIVLRSIGSCATPEEVPAFLEKYFETYKVDDTTLAAIFVGPEDFQALRELLNTGAKELMERYIKNRPQKPKTVGGYVMISDELARVTRIMRKNDAYTEAVCRHILELARTGDSGQEEGLSQIVLNVQNDHRRRVEEHQAELRTRQGADTARAKQELDRAEEELSQALHSLTMERKSILMDKKDTVKVVNEIIEGQIDEKDHDIGLRSTLLHMEELNIRVHSHLGWFENLYRPMHMNGMPWERLVPDPEDARKMVEKESQFFYDYLCLTLAWYQRFGFKLPGLELDHMLYRTPCDPLREYEVDEIRRFLSGKIESLGTNFDGVRITLNEMKRLTALSDAREAAAQRLAEVSKPREEDEPWAVTEEVRQYVRQRDQYAARVIQEWYKNGTVPFGLQLPEEMCADIAEKLSALHERDRAQQEQVQASALYQQQLMTFWAPYKERFECWDQPQQIVFPTDEASAQPMEKPNAEPVTENVQQADPDE